MRCSYRVYAVQASGHRLLRLRLPGLLCWCFARSQVPRRHLLRRRCLELHGLCLWIRLRRGFRNLPQMHCRNHPLLRPLHVQCLSLGLHFQCWCDVMHSMPRGVCPRQQRLVVLYLSREHLRHRRFRKLHGVPRLPGQQCRLVVLPRARLHHRPVHHLDRDLQHLPRRLQLRRPDGEPDDLRCWHVLCCRRDVLHGVRLGVHQHRRLVVVRRPRLVSRRPVPRRKQLLPDVRR